MSHYVTMLAVTIVLGGLVASVPLLVLRSGIRRARAESQASTDALVARIHSMRQTYVGELRGMTAAVEGPRARGRGPQRRSRTRDGDARGWLRVVPEERSGASRGEIPD